MEAVLGGASLTSMFSNNVNSDLYVGKVNDKILVEELSQLSYRIKGILKINFKLVPANSITLEELGKH